MFISVKEAAELTGKSTTTIYRLCNKRKNTQFVKKEDNKFLIDKDFLLATYPDESDMVAEVNEPDQPLTVPDEEKNLNIGKNAADSEPAIVLENDITDVSKSKKLNEGEEIKKGTTLEFEGKKSFYNDLNSREVMIGISIFLVIIFLFIYLMSTIPG